MHASLTRIRLCAFLLLALCLVPARAEVIYDSFGPGDAFLDGRNVSVANAPVTINGVQVGTDLDWAADFTTPNDYYRLQAIELPLSLVLNSLENEVDIALHASSGNFPGALMETFHLSGGLSQAGSIITFASALQPLLAPATRYWVEMSAGQAGSTLAIRTGWHTSPTVRDTAVSQLDEGAWSSSGVLGQALAMRINAVLSPIPEPHTYALLLAGLALLGFAARRKQGQTTFSGTRT